MEYKLRTCKEAPQGHFDALLKSLGAAFLVETHQDLKIRRVHRPAKCLTCQVRKDALGTCISASLFLVGWHTKILRRLGVSLTPVILSGPPIATL